MSVDATGVDVTVAVPVKDRRERMERCLRSLLAQDHQSYEVVVLDNESTDGTADACLALAASSDVPVRIERVPGTVGAVRNQGGRIARGRFIAFTDSDCIADRGWLTALVRALESDSALGVVCGATRPEQSAVARWPATLDVTSWSGRFESCNVAFRTEAFRDSAGFDEEVGHFWEDTAAGYAVLSRGWRAAFVPNALIFHDVTYPGFAWHLRRAMKARNLGPVLRRYPQITRDLFWGRVFLNRRDPELLLALASAGIAAAARRVSPLLLTLPYVCDRWRPWRDPIAAWQTPIYDATMIIGCLRASRAAGRLVL